MLAVAGSGPVSGNAPEVLASSTAEKRAAIESGHAIVDAMPDRDVDVAVIGAVHTAADAGRQVAWFREIPRSLPFPRNPTVDVGPRVALALLCGLTTKTRGTQA